MTGQELYHLVDRAKRRVGLGHIDSTMTSDDSFMLRVHFMKPVSAQEQRWFTNSIGEDLPVWIIVKTSCEYGEAR